MGDYRRDVLLKEYGEVCNNFRLLTDIRFKLLAFLPIATAAAAVLKGDSLGMGSLVISIFGLAVTIGLVTYNARNDQLYNELVGRAASIERSLGLPDGAFANRPHAWLTIRLPGVNWTVDHGTGVGFIYAASVTLWLFGSLAPILEIARSTYLELGFRHFVVFDTSVWVQILALVLAVLVTSLMVRVVRTQRKRRTKIMRSLAARAYERAFSLDLSDAAQDRCLLDSCAELADEKVETIGARAKFYAAPDSGSIGFYLPSGYKEQAASQFIALLTDLPPRWIFDCATNRTGKLKAQ